MILFETIAIRGPKNKLQIFCGRAESMVPFFQLSELSWLAFLRAFVFLWLALNAIEKVGAR